MDRLRERASRLKEESMCLQKALENACTPQVEDVRSFLESEGGVELAGEILLSGGLDLLEKIQKRYPEFVLSLEDLLGEEEEGGAGQGDIVPTPSAEGQGAVGEGPVPGAEQVAGLRELGGDA
ncbi:unnamed protein product [Prunus armeniaca]|uniref:Uncharacterized protein n=1 Tax=Prunus armeniaca TaxID=36596 RepID=A0A6J5XP04_PRUAR|nr:unnamed protein product [Prunus armeniaca]